MERVEGNFEIKGEIFSCYTLREIVSVAVACNWPAEPAGTYLEQMALMGIWRAKSDQGGQRVVYMFSEYLAPDYY
jgi:hypothetical protein